MLTTIALVVFLTSVVVLFAQELKSFGKNLAMNKWVQLIVPLLIISILILYFEDFVFSILLFCRVFLFSLVYYLAKLIPFADKGMIIEKIIILLIVSLIPLFLSKILSKYFTLSLDIKRFFITVSMFLFVFVSFLLIVVS